MFAGVLVSLPAALSPFTLFLQIEEDDLANAAYGSDPGSFFANDTVSRPAAVGIPLKDPDRELVV